MRKLSLLIMALLFLGVSSLLAQKPAIQRCATTEYMQQLFQEDPSYQGRLAEIEEFTQQWIKNNPEGTRTVVTIPVVVHVVYNTTAENITDAQVQTQIDVINEDFRRLNPDVNETPAAFAGVAADCEINFCLAQRDPSGNPTNGIIHKSTTKTSFSQNNNVKFSSQGGSDAWPRDSYLNLWCCDLGSGLLGYAQFPGGPANTDGVVCDYYYFGRFGSAHAPYNLGRTATHEIGHWLNCYHIWGDDFTSCNGSDQVADTPNQADETYGCPLPTIRISCSNGPNGDMYVNYMDYTDDGCMNMFTAGQKARMQALFGAGGSRVNLLNSLGCVPPGGAVCNIPTGLNATNITTNSATLNWSSATGAVSYNVQYRPVGSGTWTTTTSGVTSAAISGLTGGTQYEFQVESDCGGGTTSGFSTSSNFTTATPGCVDIYEPNNKIGKAKAINPGVTINALIGSSTDKDFFKFSNTASEPNIRVTLSSMPTDYDLDLYDPNNVKIASSQNAGTEDEVLILNTATIGLYKVRVYGPGGVFNASDCYDLLAEISSSPFKLVNNQNAFAKPVNTLENIYPNPSNGNITVVYNSDSKTPVQLNVYDMMGRIVWNGKEYAVDGNNTFNISLPELNSGVYMFVVMNGSETSHSKFTIEK